MSESTYRCVLCEWTGPLPEDARQLTGGKGNTTIVYKFADGTVHSIKKQRIKKTRHGAEEQQPNGIPNESRS
jgi:hypothetical protein